MGDRSTIAILKVDGTIESIYTHWNGFISGNGALLYQYHNSRELVKDLIKLGDIYQLTDILEPEKFILHTLDNPQIGVSVFYARDGGGEVVINKYPTLEHYLESNDLQGYNYVFHEKKNQWYCVDNLTKKLEKLTKHLLEDEEVSDYVKKIIKNEKLKDKLEKKLQPKDNQSHIKINKI